MTKTRPKPPDCLSADAAAFWSEVATAYAMEPRELRVLTLAAQAWDRWAAARRILDSEGLTYSDRFGAPRARPEIAVERDSRLAFLRALAELNLDEADFAAGKK